MKYRNSSVASAIALIASLCSATLSFGEVNVVELTAQQIADGYAAGEFSVVDVTQAFLDRIEQFEPNYNAFTSFTTDAIARAEMLDEELKVKSRGPLHGVPIVIKEAMDVAGLPSTGGFSGLSSQAGGFDLVPERDATIVARLRDAGAIVLGKTNIPPFSFTDLKGTGDSWAGPTFNAYDRRFAPGSSSAGTATAVAASFAVLGMAEETAGSIQNPAAAQSLVSILPTFGLVPNTGVMPIGGSTRDIVGPHAKSVYDAAITLDAIAGHSNEDPKTTVAIGKIPDGGYTSQLTATALEGKRIGLFGPGWRSVGLSGETQSLYDQAKATLASEGATLVEDPFVGTRFDSLGPNSVNQELRGMETIIYDFEQYLERMFEGAEPKAIEHLESLSGVDLFGDGGPLNIFVQFSPNRGVTNASLENPDAEPNLSQFLAIRARYQQIFGEVMAANELDALVFPHASRAPPQLLGNQEFTPIAVPEINMLGTPGITVPAGYYENGSPFSLMFLGEQFDEAELLGYAFDFEQATQLRIPPELSVLGDFNGNGMFDVTDIDALSMEVRRSTSNIFFDLNGDGRDDAADIKIWVTELANTYIGDANLDGEFNSADLIKVFQQNEYEDDVRRNSVWSDGDWNGDGDFTSSDFIAAFQDGGYEKGPRSNAEIVPEPSLHLVAIGAIAFAIRRRIRR